MSGMDDNLPFGYTHRRKRSHAQTGGHEGSTSPVWNTNSNPIAHESSVHLHTFCPSFHHEQRSPAASNTFHFSFRRTTPSSSSHTPTERPASASAVHPNTSGLHLPHIGDMASAAPRRFAGDGFDYRRPAGSARYQETEPVDLSGEDEDDDMHIDLSRDEDVIDLTADDSGYGASQDGIPGGQQGSNEERNSQSSTRNRRINNGPPRLPRGMDIIIDLDNGEEEWRVAPPSAEDPGSPEIEFISSRTIDPPRRGYQAVFGRSNSEGDEVEFVGSNALPEAEVRRRRDQEMDRVLDLMGDMNGRFTHLRAQVERFNAQVNRTAANFRRAPVVPPRGAMRARGLVHAGFAAPGLLDFDMVGFDMGIEPVRATAPAPTYQAPPTAPEGFTRSPEEEGPLMCPNCEEELCVGDGEVKRQVWIVKTCGHVYCGECTTNRSTKRSSKGKEKPPRTKPFKECVVEDCGKKVSNAKAMFQIFL